MISDLVERVPATLRRLVFLLFLPVLGWTAFIVLWSGLDKYSLPFPLLSVALTVAFLFGGKHIRNLTFRLPYKRCVAVGAVMAVAGFVGMLAVAFAVKNKVGDNWDYGLVFETAVRMTARGEKGIPSYVRYYFAMYGNNALFLRTLLRILGFFKMATGKTDAYFLLDCTIVLNCVLIVLSILACSYCMTGLRSVQQGLFTEFLLLLTSPFYLYATFTYTDVYGLLPAVLSLFFLSKALLKRSPLRRDVLIACSAVASAFGYMMKGTVVIFALTGFFTICLAKEFTGKRIHHLAVYTATAVSAVLLLTWSNHSFLSVNGISDSDREKIEFPSAHFLMMAMNPDGSGQYDDEDVAYTESFTGKKAKREADLRELRNRLRQLGVAGTLEHVFVKKARFTYGTGTAGAPNYIVRAPVKKSKAVEFFGKNKVFFEITLLYKAMLEGFILISSAMFFVGRREEDGYVLFLKICWIGMFLFFCIWEVHPRYTFIFLPLVGSLASEYAFSRRDD